MKDLRLLVNESATHGVQLDDGSYSSNRPGRITDDMIRAHLAGQVTLAAPVVSDEGTCRFITIDDDYYKHAQNTQEVRREIFVRAIEIRKRLEEQFPPESIVTCLTGGAGSHNTVLLDDVPIDEVVPLAQAVQARIGEDLAPEPRTLEAFPSTTSGPRTGNASRIVRLPGLYRPVDGAGEARDSVEERRFGGSGSDARGQQRTSVLSGARSSVVVLSRPGFREE